MRHRRNLGSDRQADIRRADATLRARYEDLKVRSHHSFGGYVYDEDPPLFDEVLPSRREQHLREVWADGSLRMWTGAFADAFKNPAAAAAVSEFVAGRIRERIKDAELTKKLTPSTYYFGTRRVPLENGYYEAFNRPNVTLVDLTEDSIEHIDAAGIETRSGRHDLDVIIYATGFDAGVGALNRIGVRGRGGAALKAQWEGALTTTLGL